MKAVDGRGARELAAAAAVSTALAAASFWRVWPRLSTAVPSLSLYDLGGNLWVQWWGPFALSRGLNPFFTRWLFFPVGTPLSVDSWLVTWLLAWPLSPWLGPVARYNVLACFSYAATGAAAYAFFGLFSRSRSARALAAAAFTYSAFRQYCLAGSHCDLLQTQWPVLLALAFVAALRRRFEPKPVAWLCAAALACAYSEQRSFLMTALACGLFAAAGAAFRSPASLGRRLPPPKSAALLGAAAAALLPLALSGFSALRGYEAVWRHPELLRVGLLDALRPPPLHALRALGTLAPVDSLAESAQGYVNAAVLALAAAGLWTRRKEPEARALGATVAALALLETARWPLAGVPVLRWLKAPARFSLETSLFGGALAAWGWEAARRRLPRRAVAPLAALLFCALLLETNPCWVPLLEVGEPDAGALALVRASDGAVIDLPLPWAGPLGRPANARGHLRATLHERPVLGGDMSLPGPEARAMLFDDADEAALRACERQGRCASLDERWRSLRARGFQWVLADAAAPPDPLRATLEKSGALREAAKAPGFTLYEIAPPPAPLASGRRP